jgi:hypothetical protein
MTILNIHVPNSVVCDEALEESLGEDFFGFGLLISEYFTLVGMSEDAPQM